MGLPGDRLDAKPPIWWQFTAAAGVAIVDVRGTAVRDNQMSVANYDEANMSMHYSIHLLYAI